MPIPGSILAIARLFQAGFKIYVATNQAGLARQKFSQKDLDAMHRKLIRLVSDAGGRIEQIFYCPHHPEADCACRKPRPGLIEQIRQYHSSPIATISFVGYSIICEFVLLLIQRSKVHINVANLYVILQINTGVTQRATILISAQLTAVFLKEISGLGFVMGMIVGICFIIS